MSYRAPLVLASLSLLLLAACGGTVASDGNGGSTGTPGSTTGTAGTAGTGATTSTGTTGTGASTTGTGASTTTGTGMGGATTTGTGASTTTTTTGTGAATTTGTGGGGPCSGYVDLVVGNGAPVHLTSDCSTDGWNPTMDMTALGYLTEGGPPPGGSTLTVYGCATELPGSKGLTFSAGNVTGPGSSMNGTATYSDGQGANWSSGGTFDLTVTKLGAEGDTIEGTLTAAVTRPPSQIAQSISATFKVCHIADQLVP